MTNKGFKLSKNAKTIAIIIGLFIVIAFAYFPALIEGKQMQVSDLIHFKGMSKEIQDYRESTGEEALWTNSMFSGMPSYLISTKYPGNLIESLKEWFYVIPRPASYLILSFSLFFVLGLTFGVTPWLAFAGALAYGFSSFFFIVIQAGHASKAHTLTFMALVVTGVIYAYQKNRYWGSIIAAVGLSWMIAANHPQMTYYAGIMIAILGITYLVYAINEKQLSAFGKTSALLVVAALLAVGTNFSRIYTTYEYGKYSMRGKSDLTPTDDKTSGLDKSYILDYSYDFGEAMTAFIPRFKGGGMSEDVGEKSNAYQVLEKLQGKSNARKTVQNMPMYWGSQPISNAPFYFGAVLCFLFVLGLFLVKGKDKWWLAMTVLIAFILSLGKTLPALADFMIHNFPMYNKFRDVKNIIVVQQFAMALLGLLAVREIYLQRIEKKQIINALKYSFGIVGGLAFVFVLIPSLAGNFQGQSDARLAQMGWPQELLDALVLDRKRVLRIDAFRTFTFVALAAATLWAYTEKKLKPVYALSIWVVLVVADMWPIDKKYFNDSHFVSARENENVFKKSKANEFILQDKDPNFRVLNMATSTFNDAETSFFHKSIGGYHGAKMQRYQELIDHHIMPEMMDIQQRLKNVTSQSQVDSLFDGLNAINMLNTRYMIYNPEAAPIENAMSKGNAWFVSKLNFVANADEEIKAVGSIDISTEAVADKQFEQLAKTSYQTDSTASIKLLSYDPMKLVYESNSTAEQLAVFSEVYYPKGWIAKVDGQEVQHLRVNYILRALPVPAGKHQIEFEFKPQSYATGNKIAWASSALLIIAMAFMTCIERRKRQQIQIEKK